MTSSPSAPPRIKPVEPPFSAAVADELSRWQPGDKPALALFRTLMRHLPLAGAMYPLGHYFLSRESALPLRDREVVIDRVCARCGCEYEWGGHARVFGAAAALEEAHLRSSAIGNAEDSCWTDSDRLLIRMVDELHDAGKITDDLWAAMAPRWSVEQMLELMVLAGWYHAISFLANGARVPLEEWGIRFPASK
ncbi:MAG: carboxymuconolactone decarboxylase family protein [Candidatus Binataceae bacterium]